jgi:hypothetical protein
VSGPIPVSSSLSYRPGKMVIMDWTPWLTRWSEEWLRSADPAQLDAEVLRDRWLGFAPATPEAVAAAETRIGRPLPPSYREFLLTTDGWRNAGCFVWRMRDTTNLGWLRDIEPFWEEWENIGAEDTPDPDAGNRFSRGLLISWEADAGVLFLDPGDVDDAGEWAAYSLFSWRARPPTRYPSFTALMESLYAEFHRMRRPAGATRDGWDARVDQARRDAIAGDLDGAAAVLAQAEEFGRVRAIVLRVQLLLLLGRRSEADQLLNRLLHPSGLPGGFLTDPLFTEEFLPLLFAQHAESATPHHRWPLAGCGPANPAGRRVRGPDSCHSRRGPALGAGRRRRTHPDRDHLSGRSRATRPAFSADRRAELPQPFRPGRTVRTRRPAAGAATAARRARRLPVAVPRRGVRLPAANLAATPHEALGPCHRSLTATDQRLRSRSPGG